MEIRFPHVSVLCVVSSLDLLGIVFFVDYKRDKTFKLRLNPKQLLLKSSIIKMNSNEQSKSEKY